MEAEFIMEAFQLDFNRTSKNIFQNFDVKIGVENKRGCPLFIVASEDKLYFDLICLKI